MSELTTFLPAAVGTRLTLFDRISYTEIRAPDEPAVDRSDHVVIGWRIGYGEGYYSPDPVCIPELSGLDLTDCYYAVTFPDGTIIGHPSWGDGRVIEDLDAFATKAEIESREKLTLEARQIAATRTLAMEFASTYRNGFEVDGSWSKVYSHYIDAMKQSRLTIPMLLKRKFGAPDALIQQIQDNGHLWNEFLEAFFRDVLVLNQGP
jgi:hypothetical protein